MNLQLSAETSRLFEQVCRENFRTPELQILYWIGASRAEKLLLLPQQKPKIGRPSKAWTPEQREAARERMKKQWAEGSIKGRTKNVLDAVAEGNFDD
jgi:hypothetical protein